MPGVPLRNLQLSRHFKSSTHQMRELTFFDIACATPNISWAPNPCKLRYAMNCKKIPFKTEFLRLVFLLFQSLNRVSSSLPDIGPNHKSIGITPHKAGKLRPIVFLKLH